MKFLLFSAFLVSLPCLSFTSDKSDQLPNVNHDNVTNNINIQLSPRAMHRSSKIATAGPKHPAVEAAHEEMKRRQDEDDFITCCCFFKLKKLPLH